MGTKIEWTDESWNPVTGCTKISDGCANCYAERMAKRLRAIGLAKYTQGFAVTCHPNCLHEPDHWRRPRMVFVCSMGDLFHEDVPDDFIRCVFATMVRENQHTYQVLTKRPHRMRQFARSILWPKNVWAGVTVENDDVADRLYILKDVAAPVRFVSLEPLIGPVSRMLLSYVDQPYPLEFLQWVILGGETGPGSRAMPAGWPQRIRDACLASGVPFFFKQWGDAYKTRGRILEGEVWNQMPYTLTTGGD